MCDNDAAAWKLFCYKAVSYQDMIYVVGGWDGTERLATGEVYDPCTGRWSSLPAMNTARSNHTVSILGSKVYVAGINFKRCSCLKSLFLSRWLRRT